MGFSTLTILVAIAAALVICAVSIRRRRLRFAAVVSVIALGGIALAFRGSGSTRDARPTGTKAGPSLPGLAQLSDAMPAQELSDGYVSSQACAECHAHQHATWHASYHRSMTQRATPDNVLGDFAN